MMLEYFFQKACRVVFFYLFQDFAYGQKVLADHLDVYSIKCDQTGYSVQECLYDYHWSDTGYDQLQINLLS